MTVATVAKITGEATGGVSSLPQNLTGTTVTPTAVAAVAAYAAGTTYSTGQYVAYVDQTWISLQDNNTGNTPQIGSAFWSLANDYVTVCSCASGLAATNSSNRIVFNILNRPTTPDDVTIPQIDSIEVAVCTTATSGKGAVVARPGINAAGTLPQTTASAQMNDRTIYTVTLNADLTVDLKVAKPTDTVNRTVTVTYFVDTAI